MNLCIDWGNTRVKAAIFQEDKLIKDYNFSEEEALSHLMGIVDEYKPDFVFCGQSSAGAESFIAGADQIAGVER